MLTVVHVSSVTSVKLSMTTSALLEYKLMAVLCDLTPNHQYAPVTIQCMTTGSSDVTMDTAQVQTQPY